MTKKSTKKIKDESAREIRAEELWEFIDYLCKYHENDMKDYEEREARSRQYFAEYLEQAKHNSYIGNIHNVMSKIQSLHLDAYTNSWISMHLYNLPIADFIRSRDKYNKKEAFKLMMDRFRETYKKGD